MCYLFPSLKEMVRFAGMFCSEKYSSFFCHSVYSVPRESTWWGKSNCWCLLDPIYLHFREKWLTVDATTCFETTRVVNMMSYLWCHVHRCICFQNMLHWVGHSPEYYILVSKVQRTYQIIHPQQHPVQWCNVTSLFETKCKQHPLL